MNYLTKRCVHCGEKLKYSSNFCSRCGKQQYLNNNMPVVENELDGKTKWKYVLFTNIFVLLISLLILIFAFIPIVNTTMDIYNIKNVNVKISTLDSIVLTIDSLQSKSYSEIKTSSLNDKAETIYDKYIVNYKYFIDFDELSTKAKQSISDYAEYTMRLDYQIRNHNPSVLLVTSAIISLAYLIVGVALLVYSIMGILSLTKKIRLSPKNMFKRMISHLFAIPMLTIGLLISLYFNYKINSSVIPAIGFYLLMAICLISFVIIICTYRNINKNTKKVKYTRQIISTIVSVISILAVFLPVLNSKIDVQANPYKNEDATVILGVEFFNEIDYSNKALTKYKEFESVKPKEKTEILNVMLDSIKNHSVNAIKEGQANDINNEFIIKTNSSQGLMRLSIIFANIPLLYVVAGLCFGAIIWQNMIMFVFGKNDRGSMVAGKITSFVFCLISVALIVVFQQFFLFYAEVYKLIGYILQIGIGPILLIIMSFINLCLPNKCKHYQTYSSTDYIKEEFGF